MATETPAGLHRCTWLARAAVKLHRREAEVSCDVVMMSSGGLTRAVLWADPPLLTRSLTTSRLL